MLWCSGKIRSHSQLLIILPKEPQEWKNCQLGSQQMGLNSSRHAPSLLQLENHQLEKHFQVVALSEESDCMLPARPVAPHDLGHLTVLRVPKRGMIQKLCVHLFGRENGQTCPRPTLVLSYKMSGCSWKIHNLSASWLIFHVIQCNDTIMDLS